MVTSNRLNVDIWIDGSTHGGNPGDRGGWGAVLVFKNGNGTFTRAVNGLIDGPRVTNNQAETDAATNALLLLTKPCYVTLHTDSNYFILGAQKVMAGRLPNKNKDNFIKFGEALKGGNHTLRLVKVEGHSGNHQNDLAHSLAYKAASLGQDGLVDEKSKE